MLFKAARSYKEWIFCSGENYYRDIDELQSRWEE
jgi:hypothetical protein